MIFYHFHSLHRITDHLFDGELGKYGADLTKEIRDFIYRPYLDELFNIERTPGVGDHAESDSSGIPFDLIPRAEGQESGIAAEVESYLHRQLEQTEKGSLRQQAMILLLKKVCDERETMIASLKKVCDEREATIASLKQVCNEREALIISLSKPRKQTSRKPSRLRDKMKFLWTWLP